MRKILINSLLFFYLISASCDKADIEINFKYEATVLGKGIDCGNTFVIELKNIDETDIADGIYYADNLNEDFKIDGFKILLNCRSPQNEELYPCTTLGFGYSHVFVTEVIKKD